MLRRQRILSTGTLAPRIVIAVIQLQIPGLYKDKHPIRHHAVGNFNFLVRLPFAASYILPALHKLDYLTHFISNVLLNVLAILPYRCARKLTSNFPSIMFMQLGRVEDFLSR